MGKLGRLGGLAAVVFGGMCFLAGSASASYPAPDTKLLTDGCVQAWEGSKKKATSYPAFIEVSKMYQIDTVTNRMKPVQGKVYRPIRDVDADACVAGCNYEIMT